MDSYRNYDTTLGFKMLLLGLLIVACIGIGTCMLVEA